MKGNWACLRFLKTQAFNHCRIIHYIGIAYLHTNGLICCCRSHRDISRNERLLYIQIKVPCRGFKYVSFCSFVFEEESFGYSALVPFCFLLCCLSILKFSYFLIEPLKGCTSFVAGGSWELGRRESHSSCCTEL